MDWQQNVDIFRNGGCTLISQTCSCCCYMGLCVCARLLPQQQYNFHSFPFKRTKSQYFVLCINNWQGSFLKGSTAYTLEHNGPLKANRSCSLVIKKAFTWLQLLCACFHLSYGQSEEKQTENKCFIFTMKNKQTNKKNALTPFLCYFESDAVVVCLVSFGTPALGICTSEEGKSRKINVLSGQINEPISKKSGASVQKKSTSD